MLRLHLPQNQIAIVCVRQELAAGVIRPCTDYAQIAALLEWRGQAPSEIKDLPAWQLQETAFIFPHPPRAACLGFDSAGVTAVTRPKNALYEEIDERAMLMAATAVSS